MTPKLDRRARFIEEYAKDLNATQAAVRAGYSVSAAHVTGSRLLSDAKVRAQIDVLLAKATAVNEITIERTVREISRLAYSDVRKLYREDGTLKAMHELDDDAAASIAGVESEEEHEKGEDGEPGTVTTIRKVKRWDKNKALDMCMSLLGMHKTNAQIAALGVSLTINLSGGQRVK